MSLRHMSKEYRQWRKQLRAALKYFPGIYLITAFLRYETTSELARFA
jgi:hypothetical protein